VRPHRNDMVFLLALWAAVHPSVAGAELFLRSEQEYLHVRVKGSVALEGGTPLSFEGVPTGNYRLRAEGRGVAVAQGRLKLTPDGELVSNSWAGADVLLMPPGFAHMLHGDRRRGWLFLGSGVGSFSMALNKGSKSRDADAELHLSQLAYDAAESQQGIALAGANLQRASGKAQDTLNMRNLWIGYFAATWVWAATEAWLLTARPQIRATGQGEFILEVPKATGWSAAWRSTLVPGSGQRYLGRTRRANLFATSVLLFGAATLVAQERYLETKREFGVAQFFYNAAQTPAQLQQARQALWDSSRTLDDDNAIRWVLGGITAGVYLWNIFDASTGGQELAEPPRLGLGVTPQPGGVQAAMSWRLP
jgi:hypothetical protein